MEFSNYVPTQSKRKWFDVVVFYTEPRESPKVSKEGQTIAKFRRSYDACAYAKSIVDNAPGTDYFDWARIVVR